MKTLLKHTLQVAVDKGAEPSVKSDYLEDDEGFGAHTLHCACKE